MDARVKVGIIGCGNIFNQYMSGCSKFKILEVVGCADVDMSRAQSKAQEYNIRAYTVDAMLADPDIQIIINLTIPAAHADVSLAALAAGKHIHSEKPLALTREDGQKILDTAQAKGLLVGCAPDTFLGAGLQTCRTIIDSGKIGTPVGATAFMMGRGPESWHPNPDFFYKFGAGPMFDMGPYYITTLIHLLGSVKRVTGSARISFPERIAKSGARIAVEIPTHIAGVLDFASGAIGTMIMSFDVWAHSLPRIEIYGSEGTLSVPDPNIFGGEVRVFSGKTGKWEDIPLTHDATVLRGIGVADMAYTIQHGRPHRASGALAYHVLDIMHAVLDASQSGGHIDITSTVDRPAPLPADLPQGVLDY